MLNRTSALIATAALLAPAAAFADMPSHNVPGERGIVFHDTMDTGSRAPAGNNAPAFRGIQCSADGWRYVGGEAVWVLDRACINGRERMAGSSDSMAKPASASMPAPSTLKR